MRGGEGWGHVLFQLCMRSWSNGEEACYVDGGGYLEEGFRGGTLRPPSFVEVERFDLPPLRGGGRRGKLFIVRSVKLLEIS